MRIFSLIISQVFNYYSLVPAVLAVSIFKTGLSVEQIRTFLPVLLIFDLVFPLLTYGYLVKTKRIAFNLTKREDRPLPFVATSFFLFLGTIFSLYFANPLFFKLHFLLFILSCTTLLITLFFKISGHMIMNTAFILILNFLFGWTLLWLVLLIPLIAFARLYLKAHTKWEVLAGTIVGFLEPYLLLKIFKLL